MNPCSNGDDCLDSSQSATMARVEKGKDRFNQMTVMKKLEDGRTAADNVKNKVAPKTGYLDTQLFPGKKAPAAYEKDYSPTDDKASKGKV